MKGRIREGAVVAPIIVLSDNWYKFRLKRNAVLKHDVSSSRSSERHVVACDAV
jgi:hypothetical protein